MDNKRIKKIGKVALDVLLYIFLAICIFCVILTVFSRRDADGAVEIFGYQMRVVTSESMAKCELTDVSAYEIKDIPLRSMVFVQVMPEDDAEAEQWYRDLKVGDVLTFRYVYTTQVTITHRVTAITEKETGGFIIELAGDNKNDENGQLYQSIDTSIPNNTNYVIGKVVGQAYLFGVIMSFLMQPIGIIFIIIMPCLLIMLLEFFKIGKVLTADKRIKEQQEREQKDNELEELRRRLAELEGASKGQATPLETEQTESDDKNDSEGSKTT